MVLGFSHLLLGLLRKGTMTSGGTFINEVIVSGSCHGWLVLEGLMSMQALVAGFVSLRRDAICRDSKTQVSKHQNMENKIQGYCSSLREAHCSGCRRQGS